MSSVFDLLPFVILGYLLEHHDVAQQQIEAKISKAENQQSKNVGHERI